MRGVIWGWSLPPPQDPTGDLLTPTVEKPELASPTVGRDPHARRPPASSPRVGTCRACV